MHKQIKNIPTHQAPITTVNMHHVAVFSNPIWIIKDRKGETVATNHKGLDYPKMITPADWLTTRTYQVELKMQEGCSNHNCEWTCNGCTAKTTMVDTTNNLVTILKYL